MTDRNIAAGGCPHGVDRISRYCEVCDAAMNCPDPEEQLKDARAHAELLVQGMAEMAQRFTTRMDAASVQIDELRNSLLEMHACYMEAGSGEPLNKQQRHRHRMALIAARTILESKTMKPLFVSGVEIRQDTVEQITGQVNHRGERVVTDEMVTRALQGFDCGTGDPNDYRRRMKFALEAALRENADV